MSQSSPLVGIPAALLFVGAGVVAMNALPEGIRADANPAVAPDARRPFFPPPTEHWLGANAESDNKSRRKAFYKRIHRTPPDLDWKTIERSNGLARLARRNRMAIAPPADDGTARWQERGSENQAGRMHVARTSPDGTQLYAGSSKGGLWRGELDGTDWEPLGDNLYGGAHWLEVIAAATTSDPPILIVATDDGLIHTSDDDGETWVAPTGLGTVSWVRRLLRHRDGSDILTTVVQNGGGLGVYRSTDAGDSFDLTLDLGDFQGDAWSTRDGTEALYVAAADGIHRSTDHGDSWTHMGALPVEASRAELTGSEAGAPRLWLVLDRVALYRSDDAGETWTYITEVSDYWGTLNASIQDADLFAWGGVHVHRTFNGGTGWGIVNSWWDYYDDPENILHADIPGLDVEVDAFGLEHWYIDTDGGLYESTDGLRSVLNLSLEGLRVSQYYDVHTSVVEPEHIAAGAQDQGYQVTQGMTASGELHNFDQILSGDYGHLTSSDGSHNVVYSVYPGFILVQNNEYSPWLEYLDYPEGEGHPWMPPIVADPTDSYAFFFPGKQLYRFTYTPGSGATYELWSEHDFSDGGGDYISALTFSPVDSSRAYAATSDGRAYHSEDGGVTWTRSLNMAPDDNWLYGQAILASSTDVDTVWIGGSGYGVPGIYRSTDGGVTFEPFSDGIEDTMVYCIGEAPDGSGTLVAGTQQTVFRRDTEDSEWLEVTGTDAPVTIYWSVEALQHENTMRFGTYGRGIWDYQLDPDHEGCFPVQDYDGDGVMCDEDCNDHDAAFAPGLPEECDGIDHNCDPTDLDESDSDGDGFPACADCDDHNAGVHPEAEEICGNLIDEDCDGADLDCDPLEPEPDDDIPEDDDPDNTPDDGSSDVDKGGCAVVSAPAMGTGLLMGFLAVLPVARRRA